MRFFVMFVTAVCVLFLIMMGFIKINVGRYGSVNEHQG